jgi:uncharacterized protein
MSDRTGKRPDHTIPGYELLRVIVGSRAHGTATERSDYDYRMVFQAPTKSFFTMNKAGDIRVRESVWIEQEEDTTGWELGKFCKLALHCNPTILEVLWAPVVSASEVGDRLRGMRQLFLSRDPIKHAFLGYAWNQRKKMLSSPEIAWGPQNWKFAQAYLRVLYQGIQLLQHGTLPVDLSDGHLKILEIIQDCRSGELTAGAVINMSRDLEESLHSAHGRSDLRDEPDIDTINAWVQEQRRLAW